MGTARIGMFWSLVFCIALELIDGQLQPKSMESCLEARNASTR